MDNTPTTAKKSGRLAAVAPWLATAFFGAVFAAQFTPRAAGPHPAEPTGPTPKQPDVAVAQVAPAFFTQRISVLSNAPSWLRSDLADPAHPAPWLPADIKRNGIDTVFSERWRALGEQGRAIVREQEIPLWMIALMPEPTPETEIIDQLIKSRTLTGRPARNPVADRAERLMVFAGAARLPTPGDRNGRPLGAEGCTAAMSKYVLAELKDEFPNALSWMPQAMTRSQSSAELRGYFKDAAAHGYVRIHSVPVTGATIADFRPGSLTIGEKADGDHMFGWTRPPAGWTDWTPESLMAIGNTGRARFGAPHMHLAQEYISADPAERHNEHGPINSRERARDAYGDVDKNSDYTNVYGANPGARFFIIDFAP